MRPAMPLPLPAGRPTSSGGCFRHRKWALAAAPENPRLILLASSHCSLPIILYPVPGVTARPVPGNETTGCKTKAGSAASERPRPALLQCSPVNIVFIDIDTLRADH